MNRSRIMLLFAALAIVGVCACSQSPSIKPGEAKQIEASTYRLQPVEVAVRYVTSGVISSDHRVVISSRLSGYIREITVREGDHVRQGQLLVQVDPVDAKQLLAQAEAELEDAKADLERYNELLKAGAVTEQQAEKVHLRFKMAQSRVEQARNQLKYAEVRSPVSGVVVEKKMNAGDLAAPGMPMMTIEDPSSLIVETYVSEKYIGGIREGAAVDVTVPAAGKVYQGVVRQVVSAADPVSHQFLVKVAIHAAQAAHPGMYAETAFHVGRRKALLIPKAAVVDRSGLQGVYVLDDKGIAHYRQVRLGREMPDGVEVLAGLHEGEVLAWREDGALHSGDRVIARNLKNAKQQAAH